MLGSLGFSGGSDSRVCLQCERPRFDPWVRKILWRRTWQPTPVFLLGKSHRWRRLAGYSPWGCKVSDTTEWFLSFSSLFLKVENWKEMPIDRGIRMVDFQLLFKELGRSPVHTDNKQKTEQIEKINNPFCIHNRGSTQSKPKPSRLRRQTGRHGALCLTRVDTQGQEVHRDPAPGRSLNCTWQIAGGLSQTSCKGAPSEGAPTILWEFPPETQVDPVNTGEKSPRAFSRGKERNHFEIHQCLLFLLISPAFRRN